MTPVFRGLDSIQGSTYGEMCHLNVLSIMSVYWCQGKWVLSPKDIWARKKLFDSLFYVTFCLQLAIFQMFMNFVFNLYSHLCFPPESRVVYVPELNWKTFLMIWTWNDEIFSAATPNYKCFCEIRGLLFLSGNIWILSTFIEKTYESISLFELFLSIDIILLLNSWTFISYLQSCLKKLCLICYNYIFVLHFDTFVHLIKDLNFVSRDLLC